MAARIIEPSSGASTWAFGSHRWVKNMGSFTRNAMIKIMAIGNCLLRYVGRMKLV